MYLMYIAGFILGLACMLYPFNGAQVSADDKTNVNNRIHFMEDIEKNTLNDALFDLMIQKQELGFEKKWKKDEHFLLETVRNLLDNPLDIPDFLEKESSILDSLGSELSGIVTMMARELDQNIKNGKSSSNEFADKTFLKRTDFGSGIIDAVESLCEDAMPFVNKSYDNLDGREIDGILMLGTMLWGDEEDTTLSKAKGYLHREFSAKIDTSWSFNSDSLLEAAQDFKPAELYRGTRVMVEGLENLKKMINKNIELLKKENENNFPQDSMINCPGVRGDVLSYRQGKFGKIVVGGMGENVYSGDFAVIIDLGGNDVYLGRYGAGIGKLGNPISIVMDFEGNDLYLSQEKSVSLGSGIFGIGILMDLSGDDTYRALHHSCGTGLFGAGILLDCNGNDYYSSGYFAQGAGNFGIGIMCDCLGNDTYRAFTWAQGFGSTWGYGLLSDLGGNDVYQTGSKYLHLPLLPNDYRSFAQGFGMGLRPKASGGIGFLFDREGNDFYNAEVFAQGASYWYSLGALVDLKGNDTYCAAQYDQGAGIHLSIGALADISGDDHYISKYGPSQGSAHDLSCGFLLDKDGDDSYSASGGQGIALTNSVAIFIDSKGNDTYSTREPGLGQGAIQWARDFAGVGIFLDLEGKDQYPKESPGRDKSTWIQKDWGVGIDLDRDLPDPFEQEIKIEIAPEDTLKPVDKIFKEASMWEVRANKIKVRKARKALILKGMEAVHYVCSNKMGTEDGLELRAIEELSKAYPDTMSNLFMKHLCASEQIFNEKELKIISNMIWLLGELKRKESLSILQEFLNDKKFKKIERTIISSLGSIGEESSSKIITPFLKDSDERTRLAAVSALGLLKVGETIPEIVQMLQDPSLMVRSASYTSLSKIGVQAVDEILKKFKDFNNQGKLVSINALGNIGKDIKDDSIDSKKLRKEIKTALFPLLEDSDSRIKASSMRSLSLIGGDLTMELLKIKCEDEYDPLIRQVCEEINKKND